MGEVAEQSEDGEGEQIDFTIQKGAFSLSVACGDSSPRGRAKSLYLSILAWKMERITADTLH